MWSLKRDAEGSQNEKSYYLTVGEHLVGRKDCQIQIAGDQSVSRKHAWITVSQSGVATAQVSLKDVSKFGCSVNGVKCQNSVDVIVKHDDKITFGTLNSSYRLKYEPLMVFASCLDNAKKKNLKSQLSKLGGYMVSEWQKGCSHLVMEALSFTVKVIYALVTCCPIVTSSFFDDIVQAVVSKSELPSPEKYMPSIKEDLIDPKVVSFHPNEARQSVFAEKLFLFLEKKQHKRLEQAITLAGGKALLKETGDISGSDENMLTDSNTLVMSVDLKSGNSEARETWIGYVGDILKSVNRRPIAETEVGLAILHVSLEEYCNPSAHRVPRIAKQIVSKSISTMEEMSQRMNESQNVTINHVPFLLKSNDRKPSTTVTTPQDTKKRSRNGSDDSQPLAFETPQSRNVESKRRKISPTDVTHVSQTPEFKTPDVPKGPSPTEKQQRASPTDGKCQERRKETPSSSKTDITHISQSEIYQLEGHSNVHIPESPDTGQKRTATSPKNDITHISQSQESQHEVKRKDSSISSPGGKKLRLTRSNANVTHISQIQEFQHEEKPSDASLSSSRGKRLRLARSNTDDNTRISESQGSQHEEKPSDDASRSSPRGKNLRLSRSNANVTHVSQSQFSQNEEKPPGEKPNENNHISQSQKSQVKQSSTVLNNNQTPKRKASEDEVTVITESQTSPIELRVKETPPEISFTSKRRKISSPDLTHVSDTERSNIAEPRRSSSVSSPSAGQLDDSISTCVENIATTGCSDDQVRPMHLKISSREPNFTGGTKKGRKEAEQVSRKPGGNEKEPLPVKKSTSFRDGARLDKAEQEKTSRDLSSIKSRVSPPGSGWMSKRSFSIKKEKSQMNQSENRGNIGIEDLGEPSSRMGFQESQGFSSKGEQQTLPEEIVVKKEEFPSDLLCVEHIELVVTRSVRPKTQQSERKFSTTLKNMKRFRKQNYAGDDNGLPRIIGGSDLVVFSSRSGNVEDWMLEVQAMNQQDVEDRDADNLFRYEPISKRRNRR